MTRNALATALVLFLFLAPATSYAQLIRGSNPCLPASVPPEQQCEYVTKLNPSCRQEQEGQLNYLELYYCQLPQWPLFRDLVFVGWVLTLFTLLMVLADR